MSGVSFCQWRILSLSLSLSLTNHRKWAAPPKDTFPPSGGFRERGEKEEMISCPLYLPRFHDAAN